MPPVDALLMLPGLALDLLRGLAAALPALATGAVQEAAGEAAAAAGMAAQAGPGAASTLRGLRFLSGAYTVVWIILAAYLVMLSLRQHRLARQVRRLKERIGA